ncbi:hypothetical protein AZI86_18405 [Bdellovibrio bacteriovorus]|uniref:HTTM domain-containing protein n=1 Tax=Bdellovibrio bacteriovorus TaxID=959 RepID=A0A150WEX3_BDEBC|nr:hypothetical protein [Bdellovibrio bacteriovorus]KYG61667.1 hypothetical protein AZI86_18405 [Bdellovibrio bacteriovorus]
MRKLKLPSTESELFKIFRTAFGVFLFFHFFFLFGSLEVLFSEKFLALKDGGVLNIFSYVDAAPFLGVLNAAACLSAIFVCLDIQRRGACLFLLYVHTCFLLKNPMILNVSYDYLGWLLLALALIPQTLPQGKVPSYIWLGGWLIFGLGYTLNGILKVQSSLWFDGTALSIIIPHDRLLANELVRATLMSLPKGILKSLTWLTVYAELLCLPLILFRKTRILIWLVILGLHLNALIIFKIKDLSLIMIFFSLFLGISFFARGTVPSKT